MKQREIFIFSSASIIKLFLESKSIAFAKASLSIMGDLIEKGATARTEAPKVLFLFGNIPIEGIGSARTLLNLPGHCLNQRTRFIGQYYYMQMNTKCNSNTHFFQNIAKCTKRALLCQPIVTISGKYPC